MYKRFWYVAAVMVVAATGTSALTYHVYHHPEGSTARLARRVTRGAGYLPPLSDLSPLCRNLMAPINERVPTEEGVVLAGVGEGSLIPDEPVAINDGVISLPSEPVDPCGIAPLVIPDPTFDLDPDFAVELEPTDPQCVVRTEAATPPAMPYCVEQEEAAPPPMPRADGEIVLPFQNTNRPTRVKKPAAPQGAPVPRMPACPDTDAVPGPPCPANIPGAGELSEPMPNPGRMKQLLRRLRRLYQGRQNHRPVHPEVDTMEFRPSDAKLSDFGFGPLF